MPSKVRQEVDGGHAYPVLRLTGALDATTARSVRSCLLSLLSRQPEAIVVDVRQLVVGDPAAAAVLSEVAREAAAWPGCPLMLAAGSRGGDGSVAGLPIRPTLDEA